MYFNQYTINNNNNPKAAALYIYIIIKIVLYPIGHS